MEIPLILLAALAEAVFGVLIEDLAQQPRLVALREKLKGISPEKLAFQRALTATWISFSREYPQPAASFFDESFLSKPAVIVELSRLLTPDQSPSKTVMVQAWQAQFSAPPGVDLDKPLSYFLNSMESEIKAQPLLKPFTDSRAFEQLYIIAERDREQIVIQQQMRELLIQIRRLLEDFVKTQQAGGGQVTGTRVTEQSDVPDALVELLLHVQVLQQDKTSRSVLLTGLDDLSVIIPRSDVAATDINNIVWTLYAISPYPPVGRPLGRLIRNAQRFCPEHTELGQNLKMIQAQYEKL